MWVTKEILTDDRIAEMQSSGIHTPEWDFNTVMLANFNNDLSASSYNQSMSLTGYKIVKKNLTTNKTYKVADIKINSFDGIGIEDFNVANNEEYEYWITPIYSTGMGDPIITSPISTDWYGWSVVGINPTDAKDVYTVDLDNIWSFKLNIEPGGYTPVFNKHIETGFGKYPKIYTGENNYLKGSLSCLIGDVDCVDYVGDDAGKLRKWREFCHSSCLKLIKDTKGHVIVGDIEDTSYTIEDLYPVAPSTISFNYLELMDYEKITVYGVIDKWQ